MGGEWPAGAALAMESWPARSRGVMSGILQGSWSLGFLLSSAVYGMFYQSLGWRGMLWIGILPALAVVFVRYFVKEPPVWVENRRLQREQKREVRAPLVRIFKRQLLGNTLTACWWMTSAFVIYYSIWSLFATHLQKDLNFSPAQVAVPIAIANFLAFLASGFWGWTADHIGRRWSMIIPGIITMFVAPLYLLTDNLTLIIAGFVLQGLFGDALYGQNPSYLSERFPTEVRATASAFCLLPRGDLWWACRADADLLRHQPQHGLWRAHARGNGGGGGQLCHRASSGSRNEGQGACAGSGGGLRGDLRLAVRTARRTAVARQALLLPALIHLVERP